MFIYIFMTITKYFLGIKNIEQQNINNVDLKSHLKTILPEKNTFIADPFLFKYGPFYYVFFELWDYNKGKIACSKLDEYYNLINIELCLDLNYHLSFPCIFTYNDHIYMIPETSSQRCIKLFECIEFPTKWKFSKNLINNISAPDVGFFKYNDIIYLLTNNGDYLKIFYSNDLFGDFTSHPINKKSKKIYSRNAGNIFIRDNMLYRPAQICNPSYGYGVALYKINKISTTEYDEELIKTYNPDWFPELTGCHTFNICDNLLITDGRLRIKSPNMKQVNSINGKVYKSTDDDDYTNNYISNLLTSKVFNNNTITCSNERNYLIRSYFPNITGICLHVGVAKYTKSYEFINNNLKYITIDINKNRAEYGSTKEHYIIDFTEFVYNTKINHINLFGVFGHPQISDKGIEYTLNNDLKICLNKCSQLIDINGTILLGPNYTLIKELNKEYWSKLFNNIIQHYKITDYSIIIGPSNIILWFKVNNYFLDNTYNTTVELK